MEQSTSLLPKTIGESELVQSNLAKANSDFAWDAYFVLTQSNAGLSDNVFFSPFSISTILHLLYLGARDDTMRQLSKTLHLKKIDVVQVEREYIELNEQIKTICGQSHNGITFHSVNKVFTEKSYNFREDYLIRLKALQSELEPADFRNNPEMVRQEINSWVEKQTAAKIKDLLPDESTDTSTRMVLVNAIYFKGTWSNNFDKNITYKEKFHLLDGSTSSVDMMYQNSQFASYHHPALAAIIVKLPFGKGDQPSADMVIVLPNKTGGLPSVEGGLKSGTPLRLNECRSQDVDLYLPRMWIASTLPLKQLLQTMGITDLFDERAANLSGMSDADDLFVSAAFHKAFIDVSEEGAEATAASAIGVGVVACGKVTKPLTIRVDHPFLLLIMDRRTQSILFMGRVLKC